MCDTGQNLDVRDLVKVLCIKLLHNFLEEVDYFSGVVSLTYSIQQPLRHCMCTRGGAAFFASRSTGLEPRIRAFLAECLVFCHTSLFTLADGQRPAVNNAQLLVVLVSVAPGLDSLYLLDDESALQYGIFPDIAVATALVVLSTEVDPNVVWDLSGTDLVPPEDVRYGLPQLRARGTVVDIHASRRGVYVVEHARRSERKVLTRWRLGFLLVLTLLGLRSW